MENSSVIVVSGLPRSGTSLIMNMLSQGGMEIVTDNRREADIDNLKGYFELEKVKNLEEDSSWMPQCRGKAIKIVSPLLFHIPLNETYRILFVRRNLNEVMESQSKMMKRISPALPEGGDGEMKLLFEKHLKKIEAWLTENKIATLFLRFDDIIKKPQLTAGNINKFLGETLEHQKMTQVVDKNLYRCRS